MNRCDTRTCPSPSSAATKAQLRASSKCAPGHDEAVPSAWNGTMCSASSGLPLTFFT